MKTIKNASIKHMDIQGHGFQYHLMLLIHLIKIIFFDDIPLISDDYNYIFGLVEVGKYHKN